MIPIYVNDIRCSLKNKCYFSALSLALTLPDICGMVEFPNKSVGERYIQWYDKYIGVYMAEGNRDWNTPRLSGEIVYNLRNTYFHQGNLGIASDKVKEEVNQLDEFVLMLGDGTVLRCAAINIEAVITTYRKIIIDVTYLCGIICDCALWYYKNNQENFKFNFNVITQEEFLHPSEKARQFTQGDVFVKLINMKLEKEGSTKRFVEDPDRRSLDKTKSKKKNNNNAINEQKKNQSPMNVSEENREAQVRSFFDRHFKKQIYLNKKEEIIQSVLKSKTKQQVNNNLMKHFTSKEVSTIYQRLEPLIKDLPGK